MILNVNSNILLCWQVHLCFVTFNAFLTQKQLSLRDPNEASFGNSVIHCVFFASEFLNYILLCPHCWKDLRGFFGAIPKPGPVRDHRCSPQFHGQHCGRTWSSNLSQIPSMELAGWEWTWRWGTKSVRSLHFGWDRVAIQPLRHLIKGPNSVDTPCETWTKLMAEDGTKLKIPSA